MFGLGWLALVVALSPPLADWSESWLVRTCCSTSC
jgi:hypothetical protein